MISFEKILQLPKINNIALYLEQVLFFNAATYMIFHRYNSQKIGIQQEAGMTPELEVGTMNRLPLPLQFNNNLNPPPPTIGQVGVTLPHLRPLAPKTIGQPSRKRPKMNPSKQRNNPSPTNNLRPKLTPNPFLQ